MNTKEERMNPLLKIIIFSVLLLVGRISDGISSSNEDRRAAFVWNSVGFMCFAGATVMAVSAFLAQGA